MLARARRRPFELPSFMLALVVSVVISIGWSSWLTAKPEITAATPVAEPTTAAEVSAASTAPATPKVRAKILDLEEPAILSTDRGSVHVVPPRAKGETALPTMTVLHGACSDVAWTCEQIHHAAPAGFLVACPTGNASCGEGADWVGDAQTKAEQVDAAMDSVRATLGIEDVGGAGNILVGFSRGAFVARDIVYARPGRYCGLVLIGAALTPDPALLRASGIRRVVLAAGDLDGAAPTMKSARDKLERGGVEARFVSLGKVYHTLPDDTSARLEDALRWVAETVL